MNKKLSVLMAIMAMIMIASLGGCSVKKNNVKVDNDQQTTIELLLTDDFSDNTIDAYYAEKRVHVQVNEPEGALEGGGDAFLINDGNALYFKKHLFQNYEECWDEVTCTNTDGDTVSLRLDYANNGIKQVWMIGNTWKSDNYVMHTIISEKTDQDAWHYAYRFFVVDKNFHATGVSFDAKFLEGSEYHHVSDLYLDGTGLVHAIIQSEETIRYVVFSQDGELKKEYVFDAGEYVPIKLTTLQDGTVAVKTQTALNGEAKKQYKKEIWIQRGSEREMTVWANLESGYLDGKGLTVIYDYDVFDESHVIYADGEGLWISDLNGNEKESVYGWKKHGISLAGIWDLKVTENKEIFLIYEENGGIYFLNLMPTKEKKTIPTIRIAVSQDQLYTYGAMVTAFNKKYPAYHVDIVEDYNPTALLTELISGQGPELIDTSLIGFREHKNLWMPLNGIFDQMEDELVTNAIDLGSIDGQWYGVVTNFWVETVVTADLTLHNWTYDDFLNQVRSKPDLEAIYNSHKDDGGLGLVLWFLSAGVNDNYFFDLKNNTTKFQTNEFSEVLKMASRYCAFGTSVKDEEGLLEGKVLCNVVYLGSPEEIAYYRIRYGDKLQYVGFPSNEGSVHYVRSKDPLALRKTVGKEEKELALLFMKYVMSEENQLAASKAIDFSLSIRKDVLEKQFDAMDETTMIQGRTMEQGLPLGDKLDVDADKEILRELMEKAKPREEFPEELNNVFTEELGAYFIGGMDERALVDHLEKRVSLFLAEQRASYLKP